MLQSAALRTEYWRTAWQCYDSNTVRLSLDEHMLLLKERDQPVVGRPNLTDWLTD